jgi:hypothetical protein
LLFLLLFLVPGRRRRRSLAGVRRLPVDEGALIVLDDAFATWLSSPAGNGSCVKKGRGLVGCGELVFVRRDGAGGTGFRRYPSRGVELGTGSWSTLALLAYGLVMSSGWYHTRDKTRSGEVGTSSGAGGGVGGRRSGVADGVGKSNLLWLRERYVCDAIQEINAGVEVAGRTDLGGLVYSVRSVKVYYPDTTDTHRNRFFGPRSSPEPRPA